MNPGQSELPLFQAIFANAFDAIVIADHDFEIKYWNRSATRLFGYANEEIIGDSFWTLFSEAAVERIRSGLQQRRDVQSSADGVIELEGIRSDSTQFWVAMTLTSVCLNEEDWTVAILRDMTPVRRRENRLRRAAATDSLSGLANRGEFQRLLESNFCDSLALAIVDIDRFKRINDGSGHLQGDDVVVEFSKKLKSSFAGALCVARFGGDEFGLISLEPFEKFAQEIEEVRKEVAASGVVGLPVTFSAGVTRVLETDSEPRTILKRADELLYQAKGDGRNRIVCAPNLEFGD